MQIKNAIHVLALCLLCACQSTTEIVEGSPEYYLQLAQETEGWLAKNTLDPELALWPDAMDEPDNIGISYSDGMAGKLTFYLDLFSATGDSYYKEQAISIGNYLLANLPQKTDSLKGKFWAFSPYGRVCGPSFALAELYKITGETSHRDGALSIVAVLDHFADNKQDTLSWDLGNDVLGGLSGSGLFLLYAHKELGSTEALEMATKAGHTILGRAMSANDGLSWKRGQNSKYILPNFSHGPAGIAYFLLSLYEATEDEQFLEGAKAAIRYLDSIAKTDFGTYLISYGFPDPGWSRAFDIGWAHGPAGVGRLFIKMHQLTGEAQWLEKAEACYKGILAASPFDTPPSEFGVAPFGFDQRFGLGGVIRYAQDLYRYTGKEAYLEFSKTNITSMLSKANKEGGLSWPIERFGFMANAGEEATFTGFFYGSTGYGTVLLEQYNIMTGKAKGTRFVDDPF